MLIDSLKQAEHQGSVNHTSSTMSMWSGAACSFTASVQKTPVLLFCCSHSYEGSRIIFQGRSFAISSQLCGGMLRFGGLTLILRAMRRNCLRASRVKFHSWLLNFPNIAPVPDEMCTGLPATLRLVCFPLLSTCSVISHRIASTAPWKYVRAPSPCMGWLTALRLVDYAAAISGTRIIACDGFVIVPLHLSIACRPSITLPSQADIADKPRLCAKTP